MFDLYGLRWISLPGWDDRIKHEGQQQAVYLQERMAHDMSNSKFLPYLSLYEFEALLFAETDEIAHNVPEGKHAQRDLKAIRTRYPTPEHINLTKPPSKHIVDMLPNYNKVLYGAIIAQAIGLNHIRTECTHFNKWLTEIETRLL